MDNAQGCLIVDPEQLRNHRANLVCRIILHTTFPGTDMKIEIVQ